MESIFLREERYLKAQNRVKNILGFYTHLISSIFIVPFIVILNLELVPQYIWFWYYIAAWSVGLLIHWFVIFGFSKISANNDWKQNKIKELMNDENDKKEDYTQELYYIDAKKKVKEVKGFYAFLIVTLITIPIITYVNLAFAPGFHFFWFVIVGMLFALFMMWLGIFGFEQFGLGKNWQQKKIKELIENDSFK